MRRTYWKNRKYPGKYYSRYARFPGGDRVFVLIRDGGKSRQVTFESHEAAKALGWKKQ